MTGMLDTILSRPRTVLTMMLVLVMAGIFTYITIPKEANPDIDVPVYYVSIAQQGISPNDAERLLVRPMETELRGLEGLKEITSIASQSHAAIVLEFQIGTDKDKVLADIRDKVDLAQAELPEDAEEPAIFPTNFALQPTIIVTLSGNVPERTLFRHAKQLQDEIEAISSVREANLKGTREEQIEVLLDLVKLESYDISQTELLNAISQYNQLVPAGFIDDGNSRFNVELPGTIQSVTDVYNIPIRQNGEGVITLGEIAEIRRNFKDASSYTRVNGKPAMSLEVVKRIGTNIIENNSEVRKVVDEFTKEWPETIKITYMIDQSSFIYEVLGSLQSAILTAIALVMIIVVGALGVRSGMLVGLAIPTSFMVGFLILSGAGLTVNMMVMFGMVLTVGMLVDGAIVVTEYADRKIAEGVHPNEAYPQAAKLMFWPVVSSTATTLAAFLPLLLWPGVPGEFMSYLPIMVIIVLSASLLTALVFLPTMGIVFAQVGGFLGTYRRSIISLLAGGATGAIFTNAPIQLPPTLANLDLPADQLQMMIAGIAGLVGFLIAWMVLGFIQRNKKEAKPQINENALLLSSKEPLEVKKVKGILGLYLRFIKTFVTSMTGNILIIAAVLVVGFITFANFAGFKQKVEVFGYEIADIDIPAKAKGVEFFVNEEPDIALLFVSARGNLSGSNIRDIGIDVEDELLRIKGIDNVVMTATAPGGGGDGGGFNPSVPQDLPADVVATFTIELANYSLRRRAVDIFAEIREKTGQIPGIKVEVRKLEGGPPTGKDVRLQVKSTDYDAMLAAVTKIRGQFDRTSDIQDIEDGRPLPGIDWELTIDHEEAGRYNASIPAIGAMIQLVTNGTFLGETTLSDADDQVEIRVRLPEKQRSLERLNEIRLRTTNGQVPLSNFIDVSPRPTISSITRRDGLYAMDIKANLLDSAKESGLTPDEKVAEIQTWLDEQEWADNIFLKFRGADEEQKESGEFLAKASAAALFLMFIILVTQFNSFYQSILTLSTVILAIVGVLIGMLITGQKFSIIMTGTGVIALAGIVVNNAIVLIDTYNQLRKQGVDIHDAILKTCGQRMRPVMLTTITTIMGLVPMAYQVTLDFFAQTISVGSITSIWWVQLSTAIISGLAFSTLLTLLLIPVMLAVPVNIQSLASAFASMFKRLASYIFGDSQPAEAELAVEVALATPAPKPKPANVTKLPRKKKVPVKKAGRPKKVTTKKLPPKSRIEAAE